MNKLYKNSVLDNIVQNQLCMLSEDDLKYLKGEVDNKIKDKYEKREFVCDNCHKVGLYKNHYKVETSNIDAGDCEVCCSNECAEQSFLNCDGFKIYKLEKYRH